MGRGLSVVKKSVCMRLPDDIHRSLKMLSFYGGLTIGQIVVNALSEWDIHGKARHVRLKEENE
jgi:hypothetical protein